MPISGVRLMPEMISQLTTFGPWERANSTLHPFGRYRTTRPTTPCTPPAFFVIANENTMSYPNLLRK